MTRSLRIGLLLALAGGEMGCTGTIAGGESGSSQPGTGGGGGTAGTAGDDGSGGSGGDGGTVISPSACADVADKPALAPARRLTRAEYLNTVRDLFVGITLPSVNLPPDSIIDGFDNNVIAQGATPGLTSAHVDAAKNIAGALTNPMGFMKCPATPTTACVDAFIKDFGLRALRRPLDSGETSRYRDFFTSNVSTYDAASAARMLIQSLLLTPNFLYRVDLGTPDSQRPGIATLGGYEIASRLSYLFWASMPDPALFTAAASGELSTPAGIETQVRRLMGDPRARAAIAGFERQWLETDRLRQVTRNATLFKSWGATSASSLADATARFLEDNFWQGDGTVASLLTSRRAFVNADVAKLYGVAAPTATGFSAVDLDQSQRLGFLTQAGMMAALAHETVDAPILRGVYVLRRFLCAPPPSPPPGVQDTPNSNTGMPLTTRQHFEETHTGNSCRSCHSQIDPIGFLFEHYDAVGQYRTQENGVDVDAATTIADTGGDLDGSYGSILDFIPRLAASPQVAQCGARHAFRFAMGRSETDDDQCTLLHALDKANGSLREFLVTLTASDAFRSRVIGEP